MTAGQQALELTRAMGRVYAQALELLEPLWQGQPNQPRYIVKRVAIRLLECAEQDADVLLGISLLRAHHVSIAEHSLKCGVLMAALAVYLELPPRARLDAVLCALLHHLGQDTHGAWVGDRGALAQRALLTLLLAPSSDASHYRQVLAAFQHELGYDGTGVPRMDFPVRQHPLTALLTLVNDFVELTSARSVMQGSQPAIPVARALRDLKKRAGTRYHPQLVDALVHLVGPVQVGSLARFADGRTGVVIRYRTSEQGWSARALDVENPAQIIDFGSATQNPVLRGVLDTLPALAAIDPALKR